MRPASLAQDPNEATRLRRLGIAGLIALLAVVSTGVLAASATAAALPDHRAYELVTNEEAGEPYIPPTPIGQAVEAPQFHARRPFRAAADGERVAYVGEPGPDSGSGETGPGEGNEWLARRGPAGWEAEDIRPGESLGSEYQFYSAELSSAFYEGTRMPLSASVEPGCVALYRRDTATRVFSPLYTSGLLSGQCGHPLFAGATPDESTVLVQSEAALVAPAVEVSESDIPPGHNFAHAPQTLQGAGCMFGCNLYAFSGGTVRLVNELGGTPIPSATFGGYPPAPEELTNFSNATSSDGSRIFWTDTLPGSPEMEHVYVLENGTTNVQVSGSGPAEYWTATPDGRYAYYTEGGGLFRFDTETNSPAEELVPGSAQVEGVLGTNEVGADGAYLYFVADGVLTGEPNPRGEVATPGECKELTSTCNLYLLHEGTVSFVAGLSGRDDHLPVASEGSVQFAGDWYPNLGGRTAAVTPDGKSLVFQSIRPLTGYESATPPPLSQEGSGSEPNPAVFVYSAVGDLACASCDPAGVAPSVHEEQFHTKLPVSEEASTFTRRFVSADGARVFFVSFQPLVPGDRNGVQDVYEWERPAAPDEPDNTCTQAAASPVTGGCTFLLSGGVSPFDSFLVDADEEGKNVFFEHIGEIGQLTPPADHNELIDARIGGGFAQTSSGCQAGCLGPAAPVAEVGAAASAGFEGAGNVPAERAKKHPPSCKKTKKKQKKHACSPKKHPAGGKHAGSKDHADHHGGK